MWTKEHSYGPISKGVVFSKMEIEIEKSVSLEQVIKAVSACRDDLTKIKYSIMTPLSGNAGTQTTSKNLKFKRQAIRMLCWHTHSYEANFSSKPEISLRKGAYSLRMTHSTATSVLHRHKTPRCQTQRTSIEERQLLGSKE